MPAALHPTPRLSVVVPLYNKGPYIGRCLASLRAQVGIEAGELDVIVIDDGSTDDSVIQATNAAVNDPRVRIIQQPNGGVSRARNAGVVAAFSDWVAFLDADDEWSPQFASTVLQTIDAYPEAVLVSTAYRGRLAGVEQRVDYGFDPNQSVLVDYDLFAAWQRGGSCPIWTSATAMRRDTLLSFGGFPAGISLGEDLLTFLQMVAAGSYVYINRPLAVYHQDTTTSLARVPSLATVRSHQRLLTELDRLVAAGTCPASIRDHHRDIHAYHLTKTAPARELWAFLLRTPGFWPARVWGRAVAQSLGLGSLTKRLLKSNRGVASDGGAA